MTTHPRPYRDWLARANAADRNAGVDRRHAEDEVRRQVSDYCDWAFRKGLAHVTTYPRSKSGTAFSDVATQTVRRRCVATVEWSPVVHYQEE